MQNQEPNLETNNYKHLPTIGNQPILPQTNSFEEIVKEHQETFSTLIITLLDKYYDAIYKVYQEFLIHDNFQQEAMDIFSKNKREGIEFVLAKEGLTLDSFLSKMKKGEILVDNKTFGPEETSNTVKYLSRIKKILDELFQINSEVDSERFVFTWIQNIFAVMTDFLAVESEYDFNITPPHNEFI